MQHPSLTKGLLKTFFALLLLPSSAFSEENASGEITVPEIVVTATKTEETPFSLPVSIETVSSSDIEREAAENSSELIEKVPGVSIEGSGMWEAAPVIRGFSGTRTLVLIDGDRENNLWAGRDPLTPFISVADIERIEILKGPSSVLYGSDALGGVINFITKKPDFALNDGWSFAPEASGAYSSVDEGWQGNVALGGGGNGFDFRIDASSRDHGDYTDGNGNKIANSQFEAMSLGAQGRYMINDHHEVSFSYRHNGIDDKGVPQKNNAPWSHFTKFDTDTWKAAYKARQLGAIEELLLKGWLVDQERVYDGRINSSTQPMYTLKNNRIDTGAKGVSLQLTFAPTRQNTLVTGLDYVHENAKSTEKQIKKKTSNGKTAKEITFPPVSDAHRDHIGFFAQDKHVFHNGSVLMGGLRYDYFSADADDALFRTVVYEPDGQTVKKVVEEVNVFKEKSDQALTASLGYAHPLNKTVNLTANIATGFRSPDMFERFSTRGGSYIILGDPDLDAEYSWNIDSGIKIKSETLTGSFSVFYSWVENYIDLQNNPDVTFNGMETKTYVNVLEAEVYGFDGGVTWSPAEHLSLFGNIASVIGKNTADNQRLNTIPPLNGLVGFRWKDSINGTSNWWIELNSEIFDNQENPAPNEKTTPGYAVFNIRSGIRFNRNIVLSVAVDNIFDRAYRNHLNYADFLYEPGINVKTSLKVTL